jgi:hypothetical protein
MDAGISVECWQVLTFAHGFCPSRLTTLFNHEGNVYFNYISEKEKSPKYVTHITCAPVFETSLPRATVGEVFAYARRFGIIFLLFRM